MKENDCKCEIVMFYRLVGKKWTMPLLHTIKSKKSVSFNELDKITKKAISPSLLSDRLKEMTGFRLISRGTTDNRITYSITPEGEKLMGSLHIIKDQMQELGYKLHEGCSKERCICNEIFLNNLYSKE